MHPTSDWRHHYILPLLAERGIAALGFTTRYSSREADLILEHTVLDMAAGSSCCASAGSEHIACIGNSGGGEIVTVYQAEAEHPTITADAARHAPRPDEGRSAAHRRFDHPQRAPRPGAQPHPLARPNGRRRGRQRPIRLQPRPRYVQPQERPTLLGRVPGALPRGAGRAEPQDHPLVPAQAGRAGQRSATR